MHGTGTALALIAAFLGAGQFKMITQRIQQGHAWLDDKGFCLAIDFEMYGGLFVIGVLLQYAHWKIQRGCHRSVAFKAQKT